jgi:hypothetical protein
VRRYCRERCRSFHRSRLHVALPVRKGRSQRQPVALSSHPSRRLSSRRQRERQNRGSRCRSDRRKCRRSVRCPRNSHLRIGRHDRHERMRSARSLRVRRCDHLRGGWRRTQ